jgi:hypothetical protein
MTISTHDISDVGKQIVAALPSQFLMLLLINTIFIIGLLWFLDQGRMAQERLLTPLLTACMQEVPASALNALKGGKP